MFDPTRPVALPAYDHRREDAVVIPGTSAQLYPRVRHADFGDRRLVRLLYRLRGLPELPLSIDGLLGAGFVLLRESAPDGFVLGLTGGFWRPSGGLLAVSAEEFEDFRETGCAQLEWNFALEPVSEGSSRVVTRTFVLSRGLAAKRRMRAYWCAIYPFSRYIRRAILRSITTTER